MQLFGTFLKNADMLSCNTVTIQVRKANRAKRVEGEVLNASI